MDMHASINCLLEISLCFCTYRVQNPDTQQAGSVGTAQGGRRGRATLGRTWCRHFGRLGSQQPLWPSSALQANVLNVSLQARTKEILCKPVEEKNIRLTRDLSPVYRRFINGTASALHWWLLVSVPTAICLCKPFHARHVQEFGKSCRQAIMLYHFSGLIVYQFSGFIVYDSNVSFLCCNPMLEYFFSVISLKYKIKFRPHRQRSKVHASVFFFLADSY